MWGMARRAFTRSHRPPRIDNGGRGNIVHSANTRASPMRVRHVIIDGNRQFEMPEHLVGEGIDKGYYILDGWHRNGENALVYRYIHVTPE